MSHDEMNRREAMTLVAAFAGPWMARGLAQGSQLPLQTTGLEHVGMTVPDQEATAKFYGRIFDPQLFQERDPPPRFYVRLGTAYFAFGGGAAPPRIDHFCALVKDYKPQEMRKTLADAGISMGTGPGGMPADPDGLRLQLLGVPGGLARTIVPGARISTDDAAIQAIGLDHIMLVVSDLEKSAEFYKKFFGPELPRTKKPERIWFGAARTRLGLEAATAGRQPAIDSVCVKIAGFDRRGTTDKLKRLGVEVVTSDDKDLLRFRDPNGIMMALKAGA